MSVTPTITARKRTILDILHQKGALPLAELANAMQVSESTLRRDLRDLDQAGLVKRHSGIVESIIQSNDEIPFILRSTLNQDEKQRIAQAALDLLHNGETIFLSGGTTTLALARLLPGQRRLTVITNSLHAVNTLTDQPGIQLVILGGQLRPGEQTMHGHLTDWGAQQLRADKFLFGIEAVSLEHGLTHSQLIEVSTDRSLAEAAMQVIVLADHTKFNKVAPALVIPLTKIHVLITGSETDADLVKKMRAKNIQVILA